MIILGGFILKNYYDFIIYLAFRTLLEYEGKRSLSVKQLSDYRKKIVEKHINYHSRYDEYDDLDFERNLRGFHSLNNNMTQGEENKIISEFLEDNSDLFSYKDGVISLKNGISYKELEDRNFLLDSYTERDDKLICGELISFSDCVECQEILGADKIRNFAKKIVDDEKKIEKIYQDNFDLLVDDDVQKLLSSANYRLALVGNLDEDIMGQYQRTINSYSVIDQDFQQDDFWLLSDELMDRDEFYKLYEQSIDTDLTNGYNKAIFEDTTLVYARLNIIMNLFWSYLNPDSELELEPVDPEATSQLINDRLQMIEEFEDEFEDYDNYYDEDNTDEEEFNDLDMFLFIKDTEYLFYLNFINNIDKYSTYHDSKDKLYKARNRLLYLLDGYGDNLYIKDNFNKSLDNIDTSKFNFKEDFNEYYALSRLFLIDLLEGFIDDEHTLMKLLYVSTYYNITRDNRIEKIINKYKDTKLGKKISMFILENNYKDFSMSDDDTKRKTKSNS